MRKICRSDRTEAEYKKICFKCGELKPLSAFYKHPRMADGHVNKCKECNKADVILNRLTKLDYYQDYDRKRGRDHDSDRYKKSREYGKRLEVVKRKLERQPAYRAKNRFQYLARQAISDAVKDNLISKPNFCEHCGNSGAIQAHHSSYAEDMRLMVTWLCTKCHGEVHRKYD